MIYRGLNLFPRSSFNQPELIFYNWSFEKFVYGHRSKPLIWPYCLVNKLVRKSLSYTINWILSILLHYSGLHFVRLYSSVWLFTWLNPSYVRSKFKFIISILLYCCPGKWGNLWVQGPTTVCKRFYDVMLIGNAHNNGHAHSAKVKLFSRSTYLPLHRFTLP